jgi:hypothetical protein
MLYIRFLILAVWLLMAGTTKYRVTLGTLKANHPGEASRSAVVDLTKGKYTVSGNIINGGNL